MSNISKLSRGEIWNIIPLKSTRHAPVYQHNCSDIALFPTGSEAIKPPRLTVVFSDLNAHFLLFHRLISLFWFVTSRDLYQQFRVANTHFNLRSYILLLNTLTYIWLVLIDPTAWTGQWTRSNMCRPAAVNCVSYCRHYYRRVVSLTTEQATRWSIGSICGYVERVHSSRTYIMYMLSHQFI